jgi:hypothetical protein
LRSLTIPRFGTTQHNMQDPSQSSVHLRLLDIPHRRNLLVQQWHISITIFISLLSLSLLFALLSLRLARRHVCI